MRAPRPDARSRLASDARDVAAALAGPARVPSAHAEEQLIARQLVRRARLGMHYHHWAVFLPC